MDKRLTTPEIVAQRTEWSRRVNIPGTTIRRMFTGRMEDFEISRCGVVLATKTVMLKRGVPVSESYTFYPCVDALGVALDENEDVHTRETLIP